MAGSAPGQHRQRVKRTERGERIVREYQDMIETFEPVELSEEALDLVAGGSFPHIDPDG